MTKCKIWLGKEEMEVTNSELRMFFMSVWEHGGRDKGESSKDRQVKGALEGQEWKRCDHVGKGRFKK